MEGGVSVGLDSVFFATPFFRSAIACRTTCDCHSACSFVTDRSRESTVKHVKDGLDLLSSSQIRPHFTCSPGSQHRFRHGLHGLFDTQVGEDLLRPTKDSIKLVRAVEHFDVLPLTRGRNAAAAEEIDGIVGDFVGSASGEHLKEADGAGKVLVLFFVRHVTHLICDVLEVVLDRFGVGDHLCESKRQCQRGRGVGARRKLLLPYHRLLDELLSEHSPLICPFYAFLHDCTTPSHTKCGNHPPFVVEVRHDNSKPLVFDAQEVLDWNFDVVKLDERCSGGCGIARLDLRGLNSFLPLDEQHRESPFGLDPGDEVVAKNAVRDPFLGSCLVMSVSICGRLRCTHR